MPELPEVETIARNLNRRIKNANIVGCQVFWPKTISGPVDEFRRCVLRSRINSVFRRGKYLVFRLSHKNDSKIHFTIHLRMSGRIELTKTTQAEPHERLRFKLSSGESLSFIDTRKFGRAEILPSYQSLDTKLGLEPLSVEFSHKALSNLLYSHKSSIKSFLLAQRHISGLGNIYVDESLWAAKIHPLRRTNSLSTAEAKQLHVSIKQILRKAISAAGTDFGDHVVTFGKYKPKIYGRDGSLCKRCRTTIQKFFLGQRGTHVCPKCQRNKE